MPVGGRLLSAGSSALPRLVMLARMKQVRADGKGEMNFRLLSDEAELGQRLRFLGAPNPGG